MHHAFISHVETIQEEQDRLGVTFAEQRGYFWLPRRAEELVEAVRRSIQTGERLEVIFHHRSLEIVDLLWR